MEENINKKNQKLYNLRKKSVWVSAVLSLFITGAGHWYLGRWGKGFLLLILQLFLWLFLLGWIVWVITPLITYIDAKKFDEELKLSLDIVD